MRNFFLAGLTVLLLMDVGLQSYNVYKRNYRPPSVRVAPVGKIINIQGRPIEGDPTARAILVEFSDYECPFCGRHAAEVGPELKKNFISKGILRHVFLNNPLSIHRNAKLLARVAVCSGQQNRFWEVHDALFDKQPKNKDEAVALARDTGVDVERLQHCLDDPETAAQIDNETKLAKTLGLNGTPSFALGTIEANGQVTLKAFVEGAVQFQTFEKAINNSLLKSTRN